MSDEAFARAFERGEIANADFHHASHLRLALAYLEECGSADEAAERMAAVLRHFGGQAGPSRTSTITPSGFSGCGMMARLLDKDLPVAY